MHRLNAEHCHHLSPGLWAWGHRRVRQQQFIFDGYYYPVTFRQPCAARDRR
jgi:hypothetical protein